MSVGYAKLTLCNACGGRRIKEGNLVLSATRCRFCLAVAFGLQQVKVVYKFKMVKTCKNFATAMKFTQRMPASLAG